MRVVVAVGLLLAATYTALIIPFSPRRHPVITPSSPCRRHPIG